MAKQATLPALKKAAVRSGKVTAAAGVGLAANNWVTEKFHGTFGANPKLSKVVVSALFGIGVPFLMERYGKVSNQWTDALAAGAGIRMSAELMKFVGLDDMADYLGVVNGRDMQTIELEVNSPEELRMLQQAAGAMSGRGPAIPVDYNMLLQGPEETESIEIY